MKLVSTAGRAPAVSLAEALFTGPAPDGGLYVPEALPPLPAGALESLRHASLAEAGVTVARHLLADEIRPAALDPLVEESLDFPAPLVPLGRGEHVLELFHGPTLAFKDVGARFMARLMGHFRGAGQPRLTILVATSGDTGSAVGHAFHGLEGFRVLVLFPSGRVTEMQRRQFTTLAGNVLAVEVDGVFDDCQRLVRGAFADRELRREVPLASANSINIGRLLPQMFYYVHAAAVLQDQGPLLFSTPSGNFGNLTAGLMAWRLGLPVARFMAATNVNDVVPRYLETGTFGPRPSTATLSSAMDVGDPSNFQRILHLYAGDREALKGHLAGSAHDDAATLAAIGRVHEATGYLMDPHTAVAWLGLEELRRRHPDAGAGVLLATAHPAKFADIVTRALGQVPALPERLSACRNLPERIISMPVDPRALADLLRQGD